MRYLDLLAFIIASSLPLAAQTNSSARPTPPISAAAIFKRSCDAGGSEEARNAIRTLHITGHIESATGRSAGDFEYFADASGKFVNELESAGMTNRFGFDGKKFWQSAAAKSFPLLQGPDLPAIGSDLPVAESPAACRLGRNAKDARVMGRTLAGGRETVVVLITDQHGNKRALYFDNKTWLLLRTDRAVVHTEGNEKAGFVYQIYFSDFRSVNGVEFPFRLHVVTKSGESWQVRSKIEVNREINPRKFMHG